MAPRLAPLESRFGAIGRTVTSRLSPELRGSSLPKCSSTLLVLVTPQFGDSPRGDRQKHGQVTAKKARSGVSCTREG
jgi:hypothetical protein